MSSLQDLLAQRAELEKKIIEVQREAKADAISKVRALMAEFGLSNADLTGKSAIPRAAAADSGTDAQAQRADPSLGQERAVALALAIRPDLLERPGASEPERWARHRDRAELTRTVRRAWSNAVAAHAGLRLQAARLEGARIGSDLGQRMVEAGNWSQARWLREQLKQAREHVTWMKARQEAQSANEALARLLGLWSAQDVQALPARLPTELPEVPPLSATAVPAGEADVLAADPAMALQREQARRLWAGVADTQRKAWNSAVAQALSSAPDRPPAITDRRLLGDHALERAVRADAALLRAAAERRSWAREAWAQLQTAQASARHTQDVLLPLLQAAEQEALLRYNGMLLSTWDVLAAANERLVGADQALQARHRYWLALSDWQALLAGGSYMPAASGERPGSTDTTPDGDH